MQLEIEQKFPISDAKQLLKRLAELGGTELPVVEQRDTYYNHPSRDFRTTDEALRIRQTGESAVVTYKGPKLGTDVKTRPEIELPLVEPEAWPGLLSSLGFREVATVCKLRRRFALSRPPFAIELTLDHVEGVGQFAEVEIMADKAAMQQAQQAIKDLAAELSLGEPEKRSYLSLLLESQSNS